MNEKYKSIIDRSVNQMKRRSGTFRRVGTFRSKTCDQNDHMMVFPGYNDFKAWQGYALSVPAIPKGLC